MDADKALRYCYIGFAIIILLSFATYQSTPSVIPLKTTDIMTAAPAMFGYLLLLSLIVERAIEVFLSTTRGNKAQELDDQIAAIAEEIQALQEDNAQDHDLKLKRAAFSTKKQERAAYRIRSRCAAQWLGLVIGMMVSIAGVRILGNIVEVEALMPPKGLGPEDWQFNFFILIDVLLTGAVLAGGSEAINRITKRFNHFMQPQANT